MPPPTRLGSAICCHKWSPVHLEIKHHTEVAFLYQICTLVLSNINHKGKPGIRHLKGCPLLLPVLVTGFTSKNPILTRVAPWRSPVTATSSSSSSCPLSFPVLSGEGAKNLSMTGQWSQSLWCLKTWRKIHPILCSRERLFVILSDLISRSHILSRFYRKYYLLFRQNLFILFPVDEAYNTISVTTQLCHWQRRMNEGWDLKEKIAIQEQRESIWSGDERSSCLLVDKYNWLKGWRLRSHDTQYEDCKFDL